MKIMSEEDQKKRNEAQYFGSIYRRDAVIAVLLGYIHKQPTFDKGVYKYLADLAIDKLKEHHPGEYEECQEFITPELINLELELTAARFDLDKEVH